MKERFDVSRMQRKATTLCVHIEKALGAMQRQEKPQRPLKCSASNMDAQL